MFYRNSGAKASTPDILLWKCFLARRISEVNNFFGRKETPFFRIFTFLQTKKKKRNGLNPWFG